MRPSEGSSGVEPFYLTEGLGTFTEYYEKPLGTELFAERTFSPPGRELNLTLSAVVT